MFGFKRKKTYKVKWLEPKHNKWFIKQTTDNEIIAYRSAEALEAEGYRVQIIEEADDKVPIYISNLRTR